MTTILVAYASKMGSTQEIAEVTGVELARAGLDVQVRDACDVTTVHGYDAVVVGSGIYAPGGVGDRPGQDHGAKRVEDDR